MDNYFLLLSLFCISAFQKLRKEQTYPTKNAALSQASHLKTPMGRGVATRHVQRSNASKLPRSACVHDRRCMCLSTMEATCTSGRESEHYGIFRLLESRSLSSWSRLVLLDHCSGLGLLLLVGLRNSWHAAATCITRLANKISKISL